MPLREKDNVDYERFGNLYSFVKNNPQNSTDHIGLFCGFSYGRYCGWSTRGPGAPIDEVDKACQDHDRCLGDWIDTLKLKCCNGKFLIAVAKANCGSSPHPGACRKAKAIILGPGSIIGIPTCWM